MRIEMTATSTGSPDGITVNTYQAQHVYDLPEDLALAFISMGVGREYVEAAPVAETASTAGLSPAVNKALTPPETKPARRQRSK